MNLNHLMISVGKIPKFICHIWTMYDFHMGKMILSKIVSILVPHVGSSKAQRSLPS